MKLKLVAVVTLSAILAIGCGEITPEEKFAGVQKTLMGSVTDLTTVPVAKAEGEPYIVGKIAVFNKGKIASKDKDADGRSFFMTPLYYRELEQTYASKAEEVGTVAIVSCDTVQKGVYTGQDGKQYPAEVEDCELTLIDRPAQKVILNKKFEKQPSNERRVYGNSVVRETAQEEVAQYLKTLPKK